MNPILKAALEYVENGICVIPVLPRDKKSLIPWKEFQTRMPTEEELYMWFEKFPERNLAIVCGAISGGLVVVDIDGVHGLDWYKTNLPITHVYTKTPKNESSYHCFYRGKGTRNSKPHPEVDIRGEGGYVVAPPSIHPNAGKYELVILEGSAGWKDLPIFQLCNINLDLSSVKVAPTMEPKPEGSRNQTLASLTGRWCSLGNSPEEILLLAQGWNSRNNPPLGEKELNQTVKSIINTHNRKHPGAVVEDGQEGLPEIDMGGPEDEEIPEHLLNPGGLLQKIMDYTDLSNVASVPVFALAGAIALVGAVSGQRIMSETQLRTNMYIISVGHSGAGKNASCSAIPQILLRSALNVLGPTELASTSALLKWLASDGHQVTLVCLDEVGLLLRGLRHPESPKADIPRIMTRLFSSTNKPDVKTFADSKLNFTIPYHCFSVYGASTPNEFWKGLTLDDGSNGFLARLLVFDSRNKTPRHKEAIDSTVPQKVIDGVARLWSIDPPKDKNRGNIANVPIPYTVPIGPEARWAWKPWKDKYFDLQNDHIDDTTKSSVYGRGAEHAQKLALIHAISLAGPSIINGGEIGTESIIWATELVDWLLKRMISNIAESMSENEWNAIEKKVLKIIKKQASEERPGVSIRELRNFISMPSRTFDDVLQGMESAGKIHRRPFKPKRGPAGILFCASKNRGL